MKPTPQFLISRLRWEKDYLNDAYETSLYSQRNPMSDNMYEKFERVTVLVHLLDEISYLKREVGSLKQEVETLRKEVKHES